MFGKTKKYWNLLNQRLTEYHIEGHIFYAICAISIFILFFGVAFDLYLGIPLLSLIMFIVSLILIWIYYQSRIKGQLNSGVILFNILCNLLFTVNYFLNSGIEGPTLIIFILSIVLNIAVTSKKHYLFWIILNLSIVSSLLTIDYYNPELITYSYAKKSYKYLDIGISYAATVLLITIIITYIRNSYIIEKRNVERKARELELSIDTKNKLFSILAHDLRAPFSSIQSYLQILNDIEFDQNEKRIIENDLLTKTKNTSQMLSNLLLWTKTQMEGVKVNLGVVNLYTSLNDTLQIQGSLANEKAIKIKNLLNEEICVIADDDMLQLVIRNLVNNAIKFTPGGGEITISSTIRKNNAIIKIADNGVGIPLEQHDKIFSFNTKPSFGTKKEKGVGLGLVLCKEFTELQQGKIWFESELEKGTSFYLSLPLSTANSNSIN